MIYDGTLCVPFAYKEMFYLRAYDIILKKRNGFELNQEEIKWIVDGFVSGIVPDYQMSALLMAIYFQGLTENETLNLTLQMAKSGDMIDLSKINGIKVDKHSTGGVGDKTSMIAAPIAAACGAIVAKMSGRGLGHTGGTVDKLESIKGFKTSMEADEFFDAVNKSGICIIGQTGDIAPADKKMYALRDVTATIDSIPLIASSIMSKKLAAGSNAIVLDVKIGSGAFMKTTDDALKLAKEMVTIGEGAGRKTVALITDMDIPLGNAIGNSLEVIEAIETLKGKGPADLTNICIELAANMLFVSQNGSFEQCETMAKDALASGKALEKFKDMVRVQGGDINCCNDYNIFGKAKYSFEVTSTQNGYISHMNTESLGIASVILGAGRETKESSIDFEAGIILTSKTGDYVEKGDTIATLYTNDESKISKANEMFLNALQYCDNKPIRPKQIYARVSNDKIEILN